MSDLVERLRRTKSPAVTMRRVSEGHYRGTNAIYVNPDGNEAAARITALEAENERLKAFEARVVAAISFAEPTDKTAQVEAAASDLRAGLSLRKCAAKHGLTFSQVRTIARQALGGPHG